MPSLNSNVMCSEKFPNKSNFHNCNAYLSECMAFLFTKPFDFHFYSDTFGRAKIR